MSGLVFSRRNALKTGFAALSAGAVSKDIFAAPRQPGETRVLFINGDYWHSPLPNEHHWREVLQQTGWRLFFTQHGQFVTPELLNEMDMFIMCRGKNPDLLGYSSDSVVEHRPAGSEWMTDAQEDAIVDNVHRGMGLICMHGSLRHPDRPKLQKLVGMSSAPNHGPQQHIKFHSINQDHPITEGVEEFSATDQQFGPPVSENEVTVLFKGRAEREEKDDYAGWCLDRGKGRIVTLLPGHGSSPITRAFFKKMMWRAAHWALKRDIPEMEFVNGVNQPWVRDRY
jgi:type 1 glutamine amidotransferase